MRVKYFLVYVTTNRLTGHYYYGVHATYDVNDGYLGSGVRLKRAINKYGVENFTRRIVRRCRNAAEMFAYEKKIVAKHLGRKLCYNLAAGGLGGWHHVNSDSEKKSEQSRATWLGRKHRDESKAKIGAANSILNAGSNNPNFGKTWISHDVERLVTCVSREVVQAYLDAGWRPGRCMRYEPIKDWPLD